MKIGEFFATLGFQADNAALETFESNLQALPKKFAIVAAAAGAALFAIDKFTEGAIRSATALQNFNLQTGESAQQLQRWQNAAQLANLGATAEDVSSSIMALEQNIAAIKLGGGNIAPFQLLGINPFQSSFAILEQLRGKLQGLDKPVAVNLLQQLGISPEMVNVLMLSNEEFERFDNIVKKTPAQVKILNKLGVEIKILKMEFLQWKDTLIADLAPALIKVIKIVKDFTSAIGDVIGHLKEVYERSVGARLALQLLGVGFAGLAVAMFPVTASFALISAAIVGLLLLIEDLYVFTQGGKSVFGRLVNYLQDVADKIKGFFQPVLDIVKEVRELGAEAYEDLPNIPERKKTIDFIFAPLKAIDDFITDQFNLPTGNMNQLIEKGNIVNQSNNFTINSNADPKELASLIADKIQQRSYNYGYADVNNGAIG